LEVITYKGTIEQWNAIPKDEDFNLHTSAAYVQCTDGKVTL
jgi:hypothetical protein